MPTLDDLFAEFEAEKAKEPLPSIRPSIEAIERRMDEFQRLIDAAPPESDDEDEDEGEDGEE